MFESFKKIIDSGWRPGLEILILAVVIYYALRFIRGAKAVAPPPPGRT